MDDQPRLRPVVEEDLAVIERLTGDPEAAGEHSWHGWLDARLWQWAAQQGGVHAEGSAARLRLP
jgi:hypothetical protein